MMDRTVADLCLTTNINHKRQMLMPPAGFVPAVPARERPQTHVIVGAATGTGSQNLYSR